jgi:hypothetical protein
MSHPAPSVIARIEEELAIPESPVSGFDLIWPGGGNPLE